MILSLGKKILIGSLVTTTLAGGFLAAGGGYGLMETDIGKKIAHLYQYKYVYYYRTLAGVKDTYRNTLELGAQYREGVNQAKSVQQRATTGVGSPNSTPDSTGSMYTGSTLGEYVSQARDATRLMDLRHIAVALDTYYADKEKYPPSLEGCVNDKELGRNYFGGGDAPVDPIAGRKSAGCTGSSNMTYAYRVGVDVQDGFSYVLGVEMEVESDGNSSTPIDQLTSDTHLEKGTGKMYYIVK